MTSKFLFSRRDGLLPGPSAAPTLCKQPSRGVFAASGQRPGFWSNFDNHAKPKSQAACTCLRKTSPRASLACQSRKGPSCSRQVLFSLRKFAACSLYPCGKSMGGDKLRWLNCSRKVNGLNWNEAEPPISHWFCDLQSRTAELRVLSARVLFSTFVSE